MNPLHDWRKAAASAAVDDEQVEKAFCDSAFTQIGNKARGLMQPPYRLGFEVVYKNEDNTRMVGIFAFRIAKDLYYAPVFFLNGEIKGTDLLYRHKTKTFVPLNQEWVQFLLDADVSKMGTGVTRQFSMGIPQHMNLHRLTRPDYANKSASAAPTNYVLPEDLTEEPGLAFQKALQRAQLAGEKPTPQLFQRLQAEYVALQGAPGADDTSKVASTAWDAFFKEASAPKAVDPILKDFIVADGGLSSMELLANAMEHSVKFANALYTLLPEDSYMPAIHNTTKSAGWKEMLGMKNIDELKAKKAAGEKLSDQEEGYLMADEAARTGKIVKKAGFIAKPSVILHQEFGPSVKVASEDFHQKGYWFEDMRKEAAIIYEEPGEMQSISEPGVYEVAVKGGGLVKVFAARHTEEVIGVPPGYRQEVGPVVTWQLIHLDSKELVQDWRTPVMGFTENEAEKKDGEYAFCKKTPESGKGYVIFDCANGIMSEPFVVKSIKDVDGLKKVEVLGAYGYKPKCLTINPDYKAVKLADGVVGTDARFIEVSCENVAGEKDYNYPRFPCAFTPGDSRDLNDYIYNIGMKSASVQRFGEDYRVRTGRMQITGAMSKVAAICHLIRELELPAATAEDLLEKSASGKEVRFRYEWPETVKAARAVMLQAEPQYEPAMDSRFNVMVDPQRQYNVHTDYTPEPIPQQRIGDAWDPSMQNQMISTGSPEQIAQMSQSMNLPNVFEHGVVGQLVKTYDSAALIQKYIPKLEDALDCLGRLLFLLYWKPQDFKQLYGADDLASKEAEILSSFKQFGDLVLSLVKQSRPEQTGNVSN